MAKYYKRRRTIYTLPGLFILTLLSSCQTATLDGRNDLAREIATKGNFRQEAIVANPFLLTSFQRVNRFGAPVNIYIEGDGLAWVSRTQPSLNPTPNNPLALELATQDKAENVIYLARPCQYTGMIDGSPCPMQYWMGSRYAPEVLRAYNIVIDQIKIQTGASELNLIGFSGGATVAALLAGQRSDISTLRSVAGNLDHHAHSRVHNVSILEASLNPPQYAQKLAQVPQLHFIGGQDKTVPQDIYRSYSASLPQNNCSDFRLIAHADHTQGWMEQWPALLAQPVICR